MMRVFSAILLLFGALIAPQALRAAEIPPQTLDSVVSVLPVWPGLPSDEGAPGAPEGTGIVIADGGWIATNVHVVGRARVIRVRLTDGRILPAEFKGMDVATDIALLKINAAPPPIQMAPPPTLGQSVCAIGNQFGLGLSLTCGVVSATHRSGTGFNPIEDFIQTDAVVNPGGSGGALVDAQGRLLGQVSAIFTKQSDANIGVNFATSSRLLMRVMKDLIQDGAVNRKPPDFSFQPLSETQRLTTAGVAVTRLLSDSQAGLQVGDIIRRAGGRRIDKPTDLIAELFIRQPEGQVTLEILRDEKPMTIDLPL